MEEVVVLAGEPVVVVDVVQEQTDEGVQEPTGVDEEPIE